MPKKIVFSILLIAITPLFFFVNVKDIKDLFTLSSFIPSQELNLEELGRKRMEYYKEPRSVIKFVALGAWKRWDNINVRLKDTITFFVNKVNAQKKEHGKKFEIIWYDTEGSAKKADDLVNKIIAQEDIFGIIGPFYSSTVSVIKNKVAAAKLLQITMTQGDIDLAVPRAKSYFANTVSVFAEAKAIANWAAKKYETDRHFIIMHEYDLYSRKYASNILRYFHAHNLNVLGSLKYEKKNTSGHVQRYISEALKFVPRLNIISIGNRSMFLDFYRYNKTILNDIKYNDFIINQDSITWEELKLLPNLDKSFIVLNYKLDDNYISEIKNLYNEGKIKTTWYIIPFMGRMIYILYNAIEQSKSNNIDTVLNYMNTQTISTPLGDVAFNDIGYIENYPVNVVKAKELVDFLRKIELDIVQ